jgi:hypothetical protein
LHRIFSLTGVDLYLFIQVFAALITVLPLLVHGEAEAEAEAAAEAKAEADPTYGYGHRGWGRAALVR